MITVPASKRITLEEKLKVGYCIPNFLRDEQIKLNCQTVKGRLEGATATRSEPIALVNYGPSLNATWEKIREFKFVMSCSGSHKFLVERGIIPTYHIDVDPRAHKVELIGQPQKETEYLIASTCHPALFKHLEGFNVKLWHIFDTSEDGLRLLPKGEWAITGGCSVGVRTLTMARFLGFTNLHVFGMDGSRGETGNHAGAHPNQQKDFVILEYEGKEYQTTPAMLEAAKNTWHELDMMKDTTATFYGEGLVQAMAKKYQRKEIKESTFIAFAKPELISATYRELNARLHRDNLLYGVGGGKHAKTVLDLARTLKKDAEFVSILDYGCGKGYLAKALPFPIAEYDPAVPGKEEAPRPADLVCCLDVLEHIEPDHLPFVLDDLRRVVRKMGYFVIHTGPSSKTLADGRNSHLIQKGPDWWKKQLTQYFHVTDKSVIWKAPLMYVLVTPKQSQPNSKSSSATTKRSTSPTTLPATQS